MKITKNTSVGVREIWAVFAKRDTSGGWREEEQVVFEEKLRNLNNLCWMLKQLLLCHIPFAFAFEYDESDSDAPLSNPLLPIFLQSILPILIPNLKTLFYREKISILLFSP